MRAINLEKLLPADIPAGERIMWHGRPEWVSLARRAFRADWVAGYFAAMISAAKTIGAGAAAVALLGGLAWLSSRTTLYVVTTRRIVMKIGIALPVFFNLPYSTIKSASVHVYGDGTGDIPVAFGPERRIAYLHLWPHARPFRINRPEPAMRSVPKAAEVAEMLSRALIAATNESTVPNGAAPLKERSAQPAAPAYARDNVALA
jgi:hypothetical protein